ncbi:DegT/DnrJ/EryC1/StrS family aminotransferase [Aestuariispira ectoiniformans]|uniref:DegT/DnrJ/EryC1/StrS family aminotransferase n=1 Tax=Aestuariispira ectoiniformans TaxID=2775080 RepID=UPI00223BDC15|nr:DegT/DnrJ/EryC1/StrS family aminotransferase [Aestuariispira ectoiniformans]
MTAPIALIDLAAQQLKIRDRVDDAIKRVLDHGQYILGPEVTKLEEELSDFTGADHVVTCANGTDALSLVMMAEGIGEGDAVFAPSFTFVATAEVVPATGATPIFLDVDPDTFTIDPKSLEAGLETARGLGLKPRAVVAVDLFGLPCDYPALRKIADREGLLLVADAAQSLGSELDGMRTGTLADYTTTSFFPAKPLGCYGDGGAVMTSSPEKAELLRSLRFHGKGADKYDNVRLGLNSRLDTMQAAILLEKLAIFEDEIRARNCIADCYAEKLPSNIQRQKVPRGLKSVWAQFTLVVEDRHVVQTACRSNGVATAVYYPLPMHQQTGYKSFPVVQGGLPVSEKLAKHVISIPMHPYLSNDQVDRVVEAVTSAVA